MFVLAYSLLLDLLIVLVGGVIISLFWFFAPTVRDSASGLNALGFLAFQIAYFFCASRFQPQARYFILYLPYIALLIPLVFVAPGELVAPSIHSTSVAPDRRAFVVRCSRISSSSAQFRDPYVRSWSPVFPGGVSLFNFRA